MEYTALANLRWLKVRLSVIETAIGTNNKLPAFIPQRATVTGIYQQRPAHIYAKNVVKREVACKFRFVKTLTGCE